MRIISRFTTAGVPTAGLAALITIMRESDHSNIVAAQAMAQVGIG